ncbi:hypothetical protein [Limosilactobacillus reuteri]|uniref:hypothetical protein n=1 Tax=Limosilactobacillus reuteri TaxID=1598 RepID=UPI001E43C325|nr:hypothetical protein [Limosilactobacillus reuteri]MCC4427879.1 hypothetical protein [Limosilactobacillus reuteri]MCC4431595.1 hypothetical protein [Limosilactobacillus reuteri]MCC4433870.1 hypothetical protein [Limosilactobacillus reuteri]
MLTYEKDVKPIKITAREAYQQTEKETQIKEIAKAYEAIREAVDLGMTSIKLWFDDLNTCDLVFNELVRQGYNLEQKKVNNDWQLEVNWENVDLDPNKKYILPMEGTEQPSYSDSLGESTRGYAYKNEYGTWTICHVFSPAGITDEYTVIAKDIEDAPEWVKAIEPVEV